MMRLVAFEMLDVAKPQLAAIKRGDDRPEAVQPALAVTLSLWGKVMISAAALQPFPGDDGAVIDLAQRVRGRDPQGSHEVLHVEPVGAARLRAFLPGLLAAQLPATILRRPRKLWRTSAGVRPRRLWRQASDGGAAHRLKDASSRPVRRIVLDAK